MSASQFSLEKYLNDPIRFLDGHLWLIDKSINSLVPLPYRPLVGPMSIDIDTLGEAELPRFTTKAIEHMPLPAGLENLIIFPNLRSTHHRRNLAVEGYSRENNKLNVANPTPFDFYWSKSGRFMHFLIGCLPGSPESDLNHARPITTNKEIRNLFGEGYIKLEDGSDPVIENGFLILHSADIAYIAKTVGRFNPGFKVDVATSKPDTKAEGKEIDLRDSEIIEMNKGLYVPTKEIISLSSHVGAQLFYPDVAMPSITRFAGLADPGFEGDLGYQPILRQSTKVERDQPILFLRLMFSKNPVGKDYSKKTGSRYQGQRVGN